MSNLKALTIAEQIAGHLREEIMRGRWGVKMPDKGSARQRNVS
ncbi:MAG: hypothetical protein AB8F34_05745 [Akkermansiaceae bacterium]